MASPGNVELASTIDSVQPVKTRLVQVYQKGGLLDVAFEACFQPDGVERGSCIFVVEILVFRMLLKSC